jgi:hypothetical protein
MIKPGCAGSTTTQGFVDAPQETEEASSDKRQLCVVWRKRRLQSTIVSSPKPYCDTVRRVLPSLRSIFFRLGFSLVYSFFTAERS